MILPNPILAIILAVTTASTLSAQETDIGGKISVELNAAQTNADACTLTFLITNGLQGAVNKVVYETVLFDQNGQVDRLTLFDFGKLPVARPRVRQFSVPQITCDQLGQIIFNGANTCDVENSEVSVCETGLLLSTRADIEVSG
ncbi:hypothetical protein OS189_13755 [Sulfitobacter sp. F26169L]|uniref:hypothetical protein n=1 Tax=Sulfitobacter sp. F26169L TaxID=2996015 RepID=UPI002260CC0E|nr:hypothetical protein [Sulfitobacter sp. F26169L]MCX7567411.1 hypothetical protein [Sulfitobacter sp. F26169L]